VAQDYSEVGGWFSNGEAGTALFTNRASGQLKYNRNIVHFPWVIQLTGRIENALLTSAVCVIVGLSDTMRMRAHPLTTALSDDRHQLSVTAVGPRRSAVLLWTQWCTGVRAILARAQQTAIRFELFAVFVRLAVHVARLCRFRCNGATRRCRSMHFDCRSVTVERQL